jgi:hypothetical protein
MISLDLRALVFFEVGFFFPFMEGLGLELPALHSENRSPTA